ncbi:MAG: NAD-dependent epimerase/dehydratase family protein [Phycisphaeraceae bacterium]|nr:NAD-dependent epimerase/dehydratase family protein [Phycisphaeraceae bacterium]
MESPSPIAPVPARALVTGARGYIGSRLCALLTSRGVRVHALARTPLPIPHCESVYSIDENLFDAATAAVAACEPTAIYHLAAAGMRPGETDDEIIQANITLGAALLSAAGQMPERPVFVGAASYWQYPPHEDPPNLYTASKAAFVELMRSYARTVACASLVLFDVYGPKDPRPKLIPAMLNAAHTGTPLLATPGEQVLDWSFVDDAAEAFLAASAALAGECRGLRVWAASSEFRHTPRHAAAVLEGILARPVPVRWGARAYPPGQIMTPIDTLPRVPGWSARIDLREGLRRAGAA